MTKQMNFPGRKNDRRKSALQRLLNHNCNHHNSDSGSHCSKCEEVRVLEMRISQNTFAKTKKNRTGQKKVRHSSGKYEWVK